MKINLDKIKKLKQNKKVIATSVVAVCAGLGMGYLGTSQMLDLYRHAAEVPRLVQENRELEQEVESTEADAEAVRVDLSTTQEQLETVVERKSSLESELAKAEEERDSLKKEWATRQAKQRASQSSSSQTSSSNSSSSSSTNTGNWITFNASAYSTYANGDPYAGKQWGNLTAMGTTVRHGVLAIPRSHPFLKLGMKVELKFPSGWEHMNGVYSLEDTFGAGTSGNRVDIYMDNYSRCLQWGRRDLQLRVIN